MAKGGRRYRESREKGYARCGKPTLSWDSFMKEAKRDCRWNEYNDNCITKTCT